MIGTHVQNGNVGACKRQRTGAWRIFCRLVGWIAFGLVVAALTFVALILYETAPPTVHIDAAAGALVEGQLQRAHATAGSGTPQILSVDETGLNSIIDSYLKPRRSEASHRAETGIRDLKINLIDDRIRIYMVLDLRGASVTVDLEGKVHTEDGYIRFDPDGGRIGALPIPQSTLAAAVREVANSPENREDLRLPPYLKDLRVEAGRIVLTYN